MHYVKKGSFCPKIVSLAFVNGYNAFVRNSQHKENPYVRKNSRDEWENGWHDAKMTAFVDDLS